MTTGSEEERAERIKALQGLLDRAEELNGGGSRRSYGNDGGKAAEDTKPFTLFDAADIGEVSTLPPTKFILGTSFAKGYVSSLIAPGATGKTAIRIAQALSIASGRELTDEELHLRCKTLIVCFEDSELELKKRVGAAMKHYGIKPEDVRGWLFYSAPGRGAGKLLDVDRKTGKLAEGRLRAYLEAAIRETGAEFICLDPLKKLHGVGENDNTAMDEVIGLLTEMAIGLDVAVDVPQHARKNAQGAAQEAGSADLARGASSGVDAMRLVDTATRMTAKEAEDFHIPVDRRKGYIRTDPAKVNLAPPSRSATWFRLTGVHLDNATEDYRRSDSIVVAERWYPPDVMAGLDQEVQVRILSEIKKGLGNGDYYSRAPKAGKRNVAHVFRQYVQKTDEEARRIVGNWIEQHLLAEKPYHSPSTRKEVLGLFGSGLAEVINLADRRRDET